MSSNIEERVRKVIDENIELEVSAENIEGNKDLVDYGMESVNYMKIVVAIENEFDIRFTDEELVISNFETIDKIVAIIDSKLE